MTTETTSGPTYGDLQAEIARLSEINAGQARYIEALEGKLPADEAAKAALLAFHGGTTPTEPEPEGETPAEDLSTATGESLEDATGESAGSEPVEGDEPGELAVQEEVDEGPPETAPEGPELPDPPGDDEQRCPNIMVEGDGVRRRCVGAVGHVQPCSYEPHESGEPPAQKEEGAPGDEEQGEGTEVAEPNPGA